MKIIDSHIHTWKYGCNAEELIKKLDSAGIYGAGCISTPPAQSANRAFTAEDTFEKRVNDIIAFTGKYPERLFPVLWVHPDEDGVISKIDYACEKGIAEFKVICCDFYPYEDKMLKLAEKIASVNRPILFHSGILWDGKPSSKYNRPLNFEELINIPHLRFALAHCSWPWIDECIAFYGKVLNCGIMRDDISSEMFIDITPGTPEIYREELIKKLFTIGYDINNNIMFGTDCSVDDYNTNWALRWIGIDNGLYDKFAVDEKARQNVYADNYFRFIGKSNKKVTHSVQAPDGTVTTV